MGRRRAITRRARVKAISLNEVNSPGNPEKNRARPHGLGHVAQIGGDYVSTNVACLDDLDVAELLAAPVRFADGEANAWWNVPAETRQL